MDPMLDAGPHRAFRAVATALLAGTLLLPLACGSDSGESAAPTEPGSREIEAAGLLGNGHVVSLIYDMFGLGTRGEALFLYGRIRLIALSDGQEEAVPEAFEFLEWALDLLRRGRLSPPRSGGTAAEGVTRMFEIIFAELGIGGFPIDPASLLGDDYVVGVVGPGGGKVTVPSAHAAIAFDPGHLSGPTGIVIHALPDPSTPGECPAGFPTGIDCYPLFFEFSLFPESNLAGTPRIGMCVVETGPFAPGGVVEARLRIASPSHTVPGTVDFWPITSAPTTIDCTDLAWGGSPGWWAALDPVWTLFSPDPLYANPGRLGASVSTFSPFAPADPGPTGPQTNGQIDVTVEDGLGEPEAGAFVQVFDETETVVDSGFTDTNGMISFTGLTVDPGGSDYFVTASNAVQAFASDEATLTPGDPTADVLLILTGGLTDGPTDGLTDGPSIGSLGGQSPEEPESPGIPQEWIDWLERLFD